MSNQLLDKAQQFDKAVKSGAISEIHEKKMIQELTKFVCLNNVSSIRDLSFLFLESKYYLYIIAKYATYFEAICDAKTERDE